MLKWFVSSCAKRAMVVNVKFYEQFGKDCAILEWSLMHFQDFLILLRVIKCSFLEMLIQQFKQKE